MNLYFLHCFQCTTVPTLSCLCLYSTKWILLHSLKVCFINISLARMVEIKRNESLWYTRNCSEFLLLAIIKENKVVLRKHLSKKGFSVDLFILFINHHWLWYSYDTIAVYLWDIFFFSVKIWHHLKMFVVVLDSNAIFMINFSWTHSAR